MAPVVLTQSSPASGDSITSGITVNGTCTAGLTVQIDNEFISGGTTSTTCSGSGTYSVALSLSGNASSTLTVGLYSGGILATGVITTALTVDTVAPTAPGFGI